MPTADRPLNINAIKYVLWVQDMDRAVAFYTGVVGLAERFTSPGWSELSWGDTVIALHGGGDSTAKETGLSLQVDQLDTACTHIADHGGEVIDAPADRPGEPIRLARIADTEGNRVMLTQYVG